MFIDKNAIIESAFGPIQATDRKGFLKVVQNPRLTAAKRFIFDKKYVSVAMHYEGYKTEFLSDDQLFEKYGDELPDNEDGAPLLFFRVEDIVNHFERNLR